MTKLIAICLLLSIVQSQMTFQQTTLENDEEQFYVLIENQTITGFCYMNINLLEQDVDFSIEEAKGFKLTFSQGNVGLQNNLMLPGIYSYQYNSCPNKIEVLIGPIKTFHIKANILVKFIFEGSSQIKSYSQLVSYNQYFNTNLNLITDSQITSKVCNLYITYQPKYLLNEGDQIIFQFPYRDKYAAFPNSEYFNFKTPDCKIKQGEFVDDSILCYFLQNQLIITKISSQSLLTIIVEGFVNPQNLKEIQDIQFQLQRFITSKFYILESSVLNYQSVTINQNVIAILIQSDDHINSKNTFQIQVKYQDFLYLDTIMVIEFPNDFLNKQPVITLSDNLNTNFNSNLVDQTLTLTNFIKTEGKQSIINLSFQIQNPLIQKQYRGLKVKFKWQNYEIAESIPQNILFSPLTFKSFQMINSNRNLIESSKYCFTFEFQQSFYQNSYVEIHFFSNIKFDSTLSITDPQNINGDALVDLLGQIVIIKNIFINTEYDKKAHFCLNGIYNPSYIDQDNESYTFSILFDNFKQVINENKQFLDLQHGYLEMVSLKQSSELTNQKSNVIDISIKTQTGLTQNDFIVIVFELNNYFLQNLFSDNNQIKCEIDQIQSLCLLQDNTIKIQTSIDFKPKSIVNILINNFISNRSLNPINNLNIKTLHQIYLIDVLPYSPNLSISKPNSLSYFFVEVHNNQQKSSTSISIHMQFKILLKDTDQIIISLPSKINCQNCVCQFHDCKMNNQKIILTNLYDINSINQIEIQQAQNTDQSILLPQTQIQVKDNQGYIIFEDQTQLTAQISQFKNFTLIPENNFIGILSSYSLHFISSIDINQNDSIILDLDSAFNVNSIRCPENYQCAMNQNQININFIHQIQKNQNITFNIESILNPNSITSLYFYTLSQYNENNDLIQQSSIKSKYFQCQFDNCLLCFSDYCQQCQQGYLKLYGKCLYDCPEGYIIIDESCKKCQTTNHCSTCSSNNLQQCLQCQDGYFLENNICIKLDIIKDNHGNSSSSNSSSNSSNSTSQNQTEVVSQNKLVNTNKRKNYSLGLLNYLEAGIFCILILYKLVNKNFYLFLTSSIILGFSIPIFRIFSLVFFAIETLYIFSSFTLILLLISLLQSFHFQAQIEVPLLKDINYKHNVQKQNYFYLNDLLFKFVDFRIICTLKSRLAKSNIFNFSFRYNDEIKDALVVNYKRLITIQNPIQFALLLTAIIIQETNNYQFEFFIYSSIEWLINGIILYQLKKNKF